MSHEVLTCVCREIAEAKAGDPEMQCPIPGHPSRKRHQMTLDYNNVFTYASSNVVSDGRGKALLSVQITGRSSPGNESRTSYIVLTPEQAEVFGLMLLRGATRVGAGSDDTRRPAPEIIPEIPPTDNEHPPIEIKADPDLLDTDERGISRRPTTRSRRRWTGWRGR